MLGFMRGGLIDYLWTGVKATYIAIFATSFATVRSSSTQGCSIFQQGTCKACAHLFTLTTRLPLFTSFKIEIFS